MSNLEERIEELSACESQDEADELFFSWDLNAMNDADYAMLIRAMGEFHLHVTGCSCRLIQEH
jgi:hypothetical protein